MTVRNSDHSSCTHARSIAANRACFIRRTTGEESVVRASRLLRSTAQHTTHVPRAPRQAPAMIRPMKVTRGSSKVMSSLLRTVPADDSCSDPGSGACKHPELHHDGGMCACGWKGAGCARCGNPLYNEKALSAASGMCGPIHCVARATVA